MTSIAIKFQGVGPWIYVSQIKRHKPSPNHWKTIPARGYKLRILIIFREEETASIQYLDRVDNRVNCSCNFYPRPIK